MWAERREALWCAVLLLGCMQPTPDAPDGESGSEPEKTESASPILPDDYEGESATLRGPIAWVGDVLAPQRQGPFNLRVGCHVVRVQDAVSDVTSMGTVAMRLNRPLYFVINARAGYRYVIESKIAEAGLQGRLQITGVEVGPRGEQRPLLSTDDLKLAKC